MFSWFQNNDQLLYFIFSFSVGERPKPSFQPATKQKYRRQERMDRRGGGLVLECNYVLTLLPGVDRSMIVKKIRDVISQMEGNETVH